MRTTPLLRSVTLVLLHAVLINNGNVKEIHDDLVTMSKAALTKEVMCLQDRVSQLKQKVEFLLSYVGSQICRALG